MGDHEDLADILENLRLANQNVTTALQEKLSGFPDIISEPGYCQWFSGVPDITETKIASVLSDFETIHSSDPPMDSAAYVFTDVFGTRINLIMIYIIRNREEESFEEIANLQNLLGTYKAFLAINDLLTAETEERLEGALFAIKSLELLAKVQFHEPQNILATFQSLQKYEELHSKAKGFVLALKFIFFGEFHRSEQLHMREQAIEQDPQYWEWHLNKYKGLRWSSGPNDEEKQEAIARAYELNPGHPVCMLRTCQFLAEYVRSRQVFPLQFAQKHFGDQVEIVDFLRQIALENQFTTENWVNGFAKIFSSILPYPYRNRELAESFLRSGLDAVPNSSRLNHRMAVFLLQENTEKDRMEAEGFLETAVTLSPFRNLPARLDLIRLYMRNLHENEDRIRPLFEIEMIDFTSSNVPIQIKFLKGYFYFKLREYEQALEVWIQLVMEFGDEPDFFQRLTENFNDLQRHWGWPRRDQSSQLTSILRSVFQNRRPLEPERASAFDTFVHGIEATRRMAPNPQGIEGNWRA